MKGKQGEYHDALFNKNNTVSRSCSPGWWILTTCRPQKMRRNGRKAKDHGVDRTPYQGDRKISYVSYHNLHGDHQGRVADADRRRTPRKGPPLPHARRRPSRARLSERRPRTHVPLTG